LAVCSTQNHVFTVLCGQISQKNNYGKEIAMNGTYEHTDHRHN